MILKIDYIVLIWLVAVCSGMVYGVSSPNNFLNVDSIAFGVMWFTLGMLTGVEGETE